MISAKLLRFYAGFSLKWVLSHGFILFENHGMRKISVLLEASKHTASLEKRGIGVTANVVFPDPKKVQLLEKIGVELTSAGDSSIKTGVQLRKERKAIANTKAPLLRETKPKKSHVIAETSTSRFRLGNGAYAINAANLLDSVKSTAPYFFPETNSKLILDEEDELDDSPTIQYDSFPESQSWSKSLAHSTTSSPKDEWFHILRSNTSFRLSNISESVLPTAAHRIDYFSLCLASHFATVATFVPTDVDSKIRGHCWYRTTCCSM